jgi:hypothetical protein
MGVALEFNGAQAESLCYQSRRGGRSFWWEIIASMEICCARCGVAMSCDPAGDCWCQELPHGVMPTTKIGGLESRQAGAQHAAPLQETMATGCLCRDCLVGDLRAQGVIDG